MKNKYLIIGIVFIGTVALFGRDALAQTAAPKTDSLNIITNGTAAKTVDLNITFISSKNQEGLLGKVTYQIDGGSSATTLDPPPPAGAKITAIAVGDHTLSAKRYGYYDYSKTLSVTEQENVIKINLDPIPGVPEINDQTEAVRNLTSSFGSLSQFPYGLNTNSPSSWSNQNIQNPILNSFYNPSLYGSNTNYLNALSPQQSVFPGISYGLTNSPNLVIPASIGLRSGLGTSLDFSLGDTKVNVSIVDPTTNSTVWSNLQSLDPYGLSGTGSVTCLRQNYPYVLQTQNALSAGLSAPVSQPFTTPALGQMLSINLGQANSYLGSSSQIVPTINNTGLNPLLQLGCPNSYQYAGQGSTTFLDPALNLDTMQNYQGPVRSSDGNYYIINNLNSADRRLVTFVDRGDGQSGFIFFPAANNGSGTAWYMTGYQRNTSSGAITLVPSQFSRVNFSPSAYQQLTNQQLKSNF